jgi:riboflavin kinase/FMN adenylyltransferase
LIPATGVYAGTVRTEVSEAYPGVVSVGGVSASDAPSGSTPTIEVRLLDFDGDLVGQVVVVDFVARMPDASCFSAGDERVVQGEDQVALARQLLSAEEKPQGD